MLKTVLPIVLLLLFLTPITGQESGKLVWKSGDELPGRVVSLASGELVWQADKLFKQPLRVDVNYLSKIEIKGKGEAATPAGKQLIQLLDGSHFFGKVKKVSESAIVFESDVAGTIELARNYVQSIVASGKSASASPTKMTLDAWESDRGNKQYWRINSNDQLETVRPNTHIFLKQKFEDSVVLDVEFQWQKNLDFVLGLGVPNNTRRLDSIPRLELWEDSLVFFYNDDFELVLESVDKAKQKLRLVILWDRKNERIVFRDASGKQLTSFRCKLPPSSVSDGVFLQNKLGDLIVSSFSIWEAEENFDSSKPAFQRSGENAKNGEAIGFDGEQWKFKLRDGETVDVAAEQIQAVFLTAENQENAEPECVLSFFDGASILGKLLSVSDQQAEVEISASKTPVIVSLSGLKKMEWRSPKRRLEKFASTLVNREGKVTGELVAGTNQAGDVLRWKMPGVKNPVSFSAGNAQVLLDGGRKRRKTKDEYRGEWPDTLYLLNGDIVPCRVVGVTETNVKIASFVEADLVPVSKIKAIDIYSTTTSVPVPTDGPDWVLGGLRSKAKEKGGEFTLKVGDSVFNPTIMSARHLKFDVSWKGQGILNCEFLSDPGAAATGSALRLALYEGAIFVTDDQSNPRSEIIDVGSNSATIEFQYLGDRMLVMFNGEIVLRDPNIKLEGIGCRFQLINSFGRPPTAKLREFTLTSTRSSGSVQVSKERKDLLLTIPRLKRDAPPKNIVCARNQDLLRGDVVALSNETLRIRSGGDVKTFPRNSISSIVWLHADDLGSEQQNNGSDSDKKSDGAGLQSKEEPSGISGQGGPDPKTDPATVAQQIQFVLNRNRRMTVGITAWEEGHLIGTSQILGDCRIPLTEVSELRMGTYSTKLRDLPYADWIAKLAPAPNLESTDGAGGGQSFGSQSPLIGQSFGRMMLQHLDGKQMRLSEYRGKIVVLDFWATWCGPCISALPKVKKVVESFPAEKVVMLAVNQEESKTQVEKFLERKEFDLNVVLDSGPLARKFLVDAIPQTVIIDGTGKVRFVKVGSTPDLEEKLSAAIEELLPTTEETVD